MQTHDDAGVHCPPEVPELTTTRLRLRAVHPAGDAAGILRLLSDPEVTRYSNAPSCTTLAEAQAALEQFPRRFAAKEMIRWAIQPLGHGEAIGTVGLVRVNQEHRRGKLGYDLARRGQPPCVSALRHHASPRGRGRSARSPPFVTTPAARPGALN